MAENSIVHFEVSSASKAGHKVVAQVDGDVVACDCFDVAKDKARRNFIDHICENIPNIDRTRTERDLLALAAESVSAPNNAGTAERSAEALLAAMPQHVRESARTMLQSPDLMQRILDDVAECGVAGEQELIAAVYLSGTSRLLPKPLSAIVQAPSSTGKSYTVEKTAALFPPEGVIHATAMTPKALVYMEPGALRHKFVVAGERKRRQDDETADATKMLREMLSSGRISQSVVVTGKGMPVTERVEQEGPIAYIETTTLSRIFNEDENRCLLLAADERHEQTACIIDHQANCASGAVTVNVEPVIQRHHALQRMLRQRPVVIPFAHEIKEQFKGKRVEARRAFPQLLSMIQASALLHQFQRHIDSEGRIVAEQFDYELAECLCRGSLARLLDGQASDAAQRFLDRLSGWPGGKCFTVAEVAKWDRKSKEAVRGWLNELKDLGEVEVFEPSRGNQPATWRVVKIQDEIDTFGFATNCDSRPPSTSNLAQVLCKNRGESAVPSEKAQEETSAESEDDGLLPCETDFDGESDECSEGDGETESVPYDELAELGF